MPGRQRGRGFGLKALPSRRHGTNVLPPCPLHVHTPTPGAGWREGHPLSLAPPHYPAICHPAPCSSPTRVPRVSCGRPGVPVSDPAPLLPSTNFMLHATVQQWTGRLLGFSLSLMPAESLFLPLASPLFVWLSLPASIFPVTSVPLPLFLERPFSTCLSFCLSVDLFSFPCLREMLFLFLSISLFPRLCVSICICRHLWVLVSWSFSGSWSVCESVSLCFSLYV